MIKACSGGEQPADARWEMRPNADEVSFARAVAPGDQPGVTLARVPSGRRRVALAENLGRARAGDDSRELRHVAGELDALPPGPLDAPARLPGPPERRVDRRGSQRAAEPPRRIPFADLGRETIGAARLYGRPVASRGDRLITRVRGGDALSSLDRRDHTVSALPRTSRRARATRSLSSSAEG